MSPVITPKECVKLDRLERRLRLSEWRPQSTGLKEWTDHVSKRHASYRVSEREQAAQLAKLASFQDLKPEWDSYGAEPPAEVAINNAKRVLRILWEEGVGATIKISPSVEGGAGIVFRGAGKKYADIECFNDGEILAITSEPNAEPVVWSVNIDTESLREAIGRIAAFLND